MKIGIDCRLWNQTGVGRYIRNLVYGIERTEYKHTYVLYFLQKDYNTVHFKNPLIEKRVADIRWHSLEEQMKFPKLLEKDQLDLMHFTYYSVPVLYGRPFVLTLHDVIISHFDTGQASTLSYPVYKAKRAAYSFVLSKATKHAKKIIVPLEATKKEVVKLYPETGNKIVVTPEGFDLRLIHKSKISSHVQDVLDSKYFLYVGNAYPHKNLSSLMQAFSSFRSQDTSDTKLVLVGKDDYFYKKLRTQFSKDIIHLTNVSDYELGQLYRRAQALTLPSLMEGFGLPALEALSVGCLVAVSDIPAFREVCGTSAIFFNPHDVSKIQEMFNNILTMSENKKEVYITKGKNQAKKFSWDIMVQQTREVYESSISI